MEVQLTKASRTCLERIKKMIMANQELVIVWMALSFDKKLLNDLAKWVKDNKFRYTDFYAVTINPLAISLLEKLNQMYKLEVYETMDQLSKIKQLLTADYSIKNIHPIHAGHALTINPSLDLSRTDDIKRAMLIVDLISILLYT